MQARIDKIVLSQGKDHCVVFLENGMTLHFNFFKLGMTYVEGLRWIEEEVLRCVNNWTNQSGYEQSHNGEVDYDKTRIIKAA